MVRSIAASDHWTEQAIAPDDNGLSRRFSITHPFHPLNGRDFGLIETRNCWGEDRVFFIGDDGRSQSLPMNWTSLRPPDPFVETSAGRSVFRTSDLLALCDLIDSMKAGQSRSP